MLRHAGASRAHVRVRAIADTLDIEVLDNGGSNPSTAAAGFGLIGMAERAAALGGRVQAGPRRNGGWRVHAVLPIPGGTP